MGCCAQASYTTASCFDGSLEFHPKAYDIIFYLGSKTSKHNLKGVPNIVLYPCQTRCRRYLDNFFNWVHVYVVCHSTRDFILLNESRENFNLK